VAKPFASAADTAEKRSTLEQIGDGVYAFTADGDPNVGAVVGGDSVLCIDARATPTHAREWLAVLREVTDTPVEFLLLTHYHAVRTLGASAFDARWVVAHARTDRWIRERGEADWESEYRRFPRLFKDAESIPGLTLPTLVFEDEVCVDFAGRDVELRWLGGAHTVGDAVAWLPQERILFAGDIVEANAAPYMGDACIREWLRTLERVEALQPEALVPGRGPVLRGDEVRTALAQMYDYVTILWGTVSEAHMRRASLKEAFDDAYAALQPRFGDWAIFEHCIPFNVARAYDEASGLEAQVWTAEKDAAVWEQLQG
jgi:glyoxylase-like metal-dependent hydrolase (beta-lactamase superfamily II)